jgi:hypothetical protein
LSRLREFVAGKLAAGIISTGWRLWLGLAAAIGLADAVQGAEQAVPFELRAEGSFPLQYIESVTGTSRQHNLTAAPYLGLIATANLAPDLSTSIFTNGGHGQLGSFRDNDNTFVSVGGNIVKRWAALSTGISVEHTHYYDGIFGRETNIANDVNIFARYVWISSPDVRISTSANVTTRLDEALSVQRYSYSATLDIQRRMFGSWWFVVMPRMRYSDYVGSESGRRDTRLAILAGPKYVLNDSISARMLVGYESRTSNVNRNSDRFSIGASIDVDVDFAGSRWPAGR